MSNSNKTNKKKELVVDEENKSRQPQWIEKSFFHLLDNEEMAEYIYRYDVILDNIDKSIFFYGIHVKFQPQEYRFLKNVLDDINITTEQIMKKIYKEKNFIRRKKRTNEKNDNLEEKDQNKKPNNRKIIKRQTPYKILSKIRKKIFNAYVERKAPSLKELIELKKEELKCKSKESKEYAEIIKKRLQAERKYKNEKKISIELFQNWHIIPNTIPLEIQGYINFDIEEYINMLINVKDGCLYTQFISAEKYQKEQKRKEKKKEKEKEKEKQEKEKENKQQKIIKQKRKKKKKKRKWK